MAKQARKRSRTATTSLILGLFFWVPMLNFIFGAAAIYLGVEALRKIRSNPSQKGKIAATAGVLLGAIPYYFSLLAFIKTQLKLDALAFAYAAAALLPVAVIALLATLKARRLL